MEQEPFLRSKEWLSYSQTFPSISNHKEDKVRIFLAGINPAHTIPGLLLNDQF
jgi:hypothetical protein